MLQEILTLLGRTPSAPPTGDERSPFARLQVASAALMVEIARMDREFTDPERAAIAAIVRSRFDLPPDEAASLIAFAERRQKENLSDWIFTKTVREGFDQDERRAILRTLWQIAYADGDLHRFESHTVERIGRDLGLDAAAIAAEKDAARLPDSSPS